MADTYRVIFEADGVEQELYRGLNAVEARAISSVAKSMILVLAGTGTLIIQQDGTVLKLEYQEGVAKGGD